MPLTKPLPRYRSIPSAVVGGTVFMVVALNCSPCSLSLTHQPSATSHSPAVTEGSDPMTVVSSRCAGVFTRRTQKPLSSLWNVTRSIRPEISSITGLRSGIAAAFMRGDSFSHGWLCLCVTHKEVNSAEICLPREVLTQGNGLNLYLVWGLSSITS